MVYFIILLGESKKKRSFFIFDHPIINYLLLLILFSIRIIIFHYKVALILFAAIYVV